MAWAAIAIALALAVPRFAPTKPSATAREKIAAFSVSKAVFVNARALVASIFPSGPAAKTKIALAIKPPV